MKTPGQAEIKQANVSTYQRKETRQGQLRSKDQDHQSHTEGDLNPMAKTITEQKMLLHVEKEPLAKKMNPVKMAPHKVKLTTTQIIAATQARTVINKKKLSLIKEEAKIRKLLKTMKFCPTLARTKSKQSNKRGDHQREKM